MFTLPRRLSGAIQRVLQTHAPSNRLAAQIRGHPRLRASVLAGIAASAYLALAVLAGAVANVGDAAWLHGVVGLLIWNGFKLAWLALLPIRMV
jgi:hypothetical protein